MCIFSLHHVAACADARLVCAFFPQTPEDRVSRVEAHLNDSKFVHLYCVACAQGCYLKFSLDCREDIKKTYNSIYLSIYYYANQE